jgi:L-amino acid N-acyltransferase YncA
VQFFQNGCVSCDEDGERCDFSYFPGHRYVAVSNGEVKGWVATSAVSDRCVYEGVVQDSIYVAALLRGSGVDKALMDRLVGSTEASGVWTIQTGIFPENEASLRLHEGAGFRVVGRRERIGRLRGTWRDVLLLERQPMRTYPVKGLVKGGPSRHCASLARPKERKYARPWE